MTKTKKQNGGKVSANNISKSIKKLLGQHTYVSEETGKKIDASNILSFLDDSSKDKKSQLNTSAPPTKQNVKNIKRVDKLTEELVTTCNKILLKREKDCQCYDKNNIPVNNFSECDKKNNSDNKCTAYNRCRRIFNNSLSGSEPSYNPEDWKDPLVVGTHNCYMYFLNDQKESLRKKCVNICKEKGKNNKTCKTKKQESCSNLKPQPGNYAYLKGNFKGNRRVYSCPAMVDKVLKDNYKKGTKKSKIIHWDNLTHHQQFIKKCPKNYYKGVLVVHPENTYHFYRQDKNGKYSHKQGTLDIEDVDASKDPIYVPHLADMNYSKGSSSGINYTDFCGYMCVPENEHSATHAN